MAFLPALPIAADESKKAKPETKQEQTKRYRLSLSNHDKTNVRLPKLSQCETDSQKVASTKQSFEHFTIKHPKNIIGKQTFIKPKPSRLEPLVTWSLQPTIPQSRLVWVEPFGVWATRKKARMLYEKFSRQMDLLYKDPDYLLDPCPHIPRCNHSHSWSAVKLGRQKFRELRNLRNEQLFQRTIEKYRNMQGLWLQQLNCASNIQHTASSQARLENFRKFAGICFSPMNEIQRLERLKERHREWEAAWQEENEERKKNSTNKASVFPRIIVTDHDTDDVHDEVMDIMLRQIKIPRAEHVDAIEHAQYANCDHFGDSNDIISTPVNCCPHLGDIMSKVGNDKNPLVGQVNFIEDIKIELEHQESFAEMRVNPGIFKPYQRTPREKIPDKCNKLQSEKYEKVARFKSDKCSDSEKDLVIDSPKVEKNDATSLSSSSSVDICLDSSPSIDDLTNISKSNLHLGRKLLETSIKEADNTARLMSHLIPVPLGMSSRKIPDQSITASSELDVYHAANQARLHNEKIDSNGGSWVPRLHDAHPYLQVDLGHVTSVQQVATQGNPESAVKKKRQKRWVTKFSLAFSENGKEWKDYEESGSVKIFSGNCDSDTVILNSLASPVETRFIRFKPKKWHNGIAMRVEVLGPRSDETEVEIQAESLHESSRSLLETENKGNDTADKDVMISIECENRKFDEVEERSVTPVILHSPFPPLLSPSVPCVVEKELQQSKFCVNHLPVFHPETPQETFNKDETTSNLNEGETADKNEVLTNESNMITLQPATTTNDTLNPDSCQKSSTKDQLLPEEVEILRQRQRAQTDDSIKQQLIREKIAEERRRKLASLKSQKLKESKQELSESSGDIYGLGSFLEKYCIFGKTDDVVLQGVFEMFDEDDDGFLWPEECLEALENVNKNLLTDSHLNYVYRILELCDSHAESGTSLRLFSVIAALSQRVVALNDKMKLLISQCDFKSIDCTLLRAKMLFECYVNQDTKRISRKDLWVGLAAGGLCRANEAMEDYFEDKQSFDFLDFLTYLPLFQLIHENVIENPLSAF